MAKFDTSKIDGFDAMTAEQKLSALLGVEIPDDNTDAYRKLKDSFDKTASELAAANKKIKASQTDEEKRAESDKEKDELIKKLTRQIETSEDKAWFIGYGYSEDDAGKLADAFADGDKATIRNMLAKHKTDFEKSIRADITKSTPRPTDGGTAKSYKTKDEIMSIKDASERQRAIADNINLFTNNT